MQVDCIMTSPVVRKTIYTVSALLLGTTIYAQKSDTFQKEKESLTVLKGSNVENVEKNETLARPVAAYFYDLDKSSKDNKNEAMAMDTLSLVLKKGQKNAPDTLIATSPKGNAVTVIGSQKQIEHYNLRDGGLSSKITSGSDVRETHVCQCKEVKLDIPKSELKVNNINGCEQIISDNNNTIIENGTGIGTIVLKQNAKNCEIKNIAGINEEAIKIEAPDDINMKIGPGVSAEIE